MQLIDTFLDNSVMADGALALPYFAGWQRLGVIWIDSPRNLNAVGDSHYADLAALVCRGAVDAVTHVWVDDKEAWSGTISREDEQSVEIDLGDWGTATLYWGRADQDFQPDLQAAGHPAYRGQCYLYLPQFLLEGDGSRAPRIEVALRRYPEVSWLAEAEVNVQEDANPAVALAELLTDPLIGLGLDAEDFDQTQWTEAAAQLAEEDAVCSPLLAGQEAMDARRFAERLCGYFGGYLHQSAEGKLRLGLLRREPPVDLEPLLTLTASHLVDAPEIEVAEWSGAFNRTVVAFRDRDRAWKPDFGQWFDAGNFFLAGRGRVQHLARPWITRREAAAALARRITQERSIPARCVARLRVRASAAEGIGVGDWFVLDGAAAGPGATLALQCTARRTPLDAWPVIVLEAEGRQAD
jgi:hypothetical protein